MINSEGYSREKDGIYLFLEKLLKVDNMADILKIPFSLSNDILRYAEKDVDISVNKQKQIIVKNIDISNCLREKEYYLYVKYSDKEISEIVISNKGEHTHLLEKNFVCLFNLTNFIVKDFSTFDVILDVKKSGMFKRNEWLNLNEEKLKEVFSKKLKIFIQQSIPQLLTNKTYHYKRDVLYTYPPLSVVFDDKNRGVYDIDDILDIVNVVGRKYYSYGEFFVKKEKDFDRNSIYLLIDYLTKNSRTGDINAILKFLAKNYFTLRFLKVDPIDFDIENGDLYQNVISFQSFLEDKISKYLEISLGEDLADDIENINIIQEELFGNLFKRNFELKEDLILNVFNKITDKDSLEKFIETFKDSINKIDVVEFRKQIEIQNLDVTIEDVDLYSVEDIIHALKLNKFFKKLFFGKIHINFLCYGEPAIPAITRDTSRLLKKLKSDFGITTSVPEFLFDYIK